MTTMEKEREEWGDKIDLKKKKESIIVTHDERDDRGDEIKLFMPYKIDLPINSVTSGCGPIEYRTPKI